MNAPLTREEELAFDLVELHREGIITLVPVWAHDDPEAHWVISTDVADG